MDGALKVRLQAPALEDRANEALCEFLAELLKRPKSAVRILVRRTQPDETNRNSRRDAQRRFERCSCKSLQLTQRNERRSASAHMSFRPQRNSKRFASSQARRLAVLRFSRARSDRASHSCICRPGCARGAGFIFVPAKGTPKKLVHKIETESLAALPGETLYYAGQDELRKNLKKTSGPRKERGDAIFAEECDSLRGDGGCGHDRAGAQLRA